MNFGNGISTPDTLQKKLELLKANSIREFENVLSSEISVILSDQKDDISPNPYDGPAASSPAKPRNKNGKLPEKVFLMQNSILTDMWSTPHFNSFYNICTALFILLIMSTTALYMADNKRFSEDIDSLFWTFGKVSGWFSIWIFMNLGHLLVFYPLYRFWAYYRTQSPRLSTFDAIFGVLFMLYTTGFVYFPAYFIMKFYLPPISSFIILLEQIRLSMKFYAFTRENVPKTLNFKLHQDGDKDSKAEPCPEFQKFIYFLFVPTLVYRDHYPRTTKTRWDFVAWNFLQLASTILGTFFAFRRFVAAIFTDVGNVPFTMEYFVLAMSGAIVAGSISMFLGFYGFLHCWLNAFAEMLTFGDRVFYKDWWNSTTFTKYYRTWNGVVHDWIYSYVYRDVHQLFGGRQGPAMITTFVLSAIVHEYVMLFTLKMFYPVLFVLFAGAGIGIVFITRQKTSQVWNIFLWFSLFSGWGMMIALYSMEWYARRNCPQTLELPWDYFVPRSWTCPVLHIPFLDVV